MKRSHMKKYQELSTSRAQIKIGSHEQIHQEKDTKYGSKEILHSSTSVSNYDLLESFVHPGGFHQSLNPKEKATG